MIGTFALAVLALTTFFPALLALAAFTFADAASAMTIGAEELIKPMAGLAHSILLVI